MKIIFTSIVILLAPLMCTNLANIPRYLKNYNVSWDVSDKVYILVRHAEKDKGDDPHLTQEGLNRAQKLSTILKGPQNMNIYSSDFNRTKETVQPIAERLQEEVMIYNARKLDDFKRDLDTNSEGIHLIAGHSNTTPTLANKLCNCSVFPSIDESDYSNIYIVVQSDTLSRTYIVNY